jgi:hypothetical protein
MRWFTSIKEERVMMWLILTPFLVLCLAAFGLTVAEAVDFLRARRSGSTRSPLSRPLSSHHLLGKKYSFCPDLAVDGMSSISEGRLGCSD